MPWTEKVMVWLLQKSWHNTTFLPHLAPFLSPFTAQTGISSLGHKNIPKNTTIVVSVNKQLLLAISHTGKVIRKPDLVSWCFCSLVLIGVSGLPFSRGARYRAEHTVAFQIKVWKSQSIQIKFFQKRKCFIHQNNIMFQVESLLFPDLDVSSDQNNLTTSMKV